MTRCLQDWQFAEQVRCIKTHSISNCGFECCLGKNTVQTNQHAAAAAAVHLRFCPSFLANGQRMKIAWLDQTERTACFTAFTQIEVKWDFKRFIALIMANTWEFITKTLFILTIIWTKLFVYSLDSWCMQNGRQRCFFQVLAYFYAATNSNEGLGNWKKLDHQWEMKRQRIKKIFWWFTAKLQKIVNNRTCSGRFASK